MLSDWNIHNNLTISSDFDVHNNLTISSDFDGGAGQFMFQEPEVVESAPQDIPLGAVHSNDKLMEELEEQMETLQKLREKDMQKIASLSEKLEQVQRTF